MQSQQQVWPIPDGDAPEGKAASSYQVDLTNGAQQIFITQGDKNISRVRNLYCDNPSNKNITVTIASTGQVISIPSGLRGVYYPIVSPMPFVCSVYPASAGIDKPVTLIFGNFDLPYGNVV